jgi:hypothetical protein
MSVKGSLDYARSRKGVALCIYQLTTNTRHWFCSTNLKVKATLQTNFARLIVHTLPKYHIARSDKVKNLVQ